MEWLLIIITVLAVIGFIISGILFITASGSGGAEKAKGWLTYSIIGIIVALIGYIVVQLVANLLGGTGGTNAY
jgi:amino acid transporter